MDTWNIFCYIIYLIVGRDGQRVVSVPLDIPLSLQTLRDVLDKSQYTCRALQHSRKLLMLYLSGQQHSKSILKNNLFLLFIFSP